MTSATAILTVHTAAVAPSITTQPANQSVTAGQTATFSVVAGGTAPLSYQWQKGGAAIAGATAPSYTT
ncbi:MAG TPA: immunoglobulin domain-containing protein, partial [Steroidobacteraceae bacterium]